MKLIKKIIIDVLYVSKLTGTNNKKVLIALSVFFSQLSALTDLFLIAVFSFLITEQMTQIVLVNDILNFVIKNKLLIVPVVFFRFGFQYLQSMILKNIEYRVDKNLKIYLLKEIYDKRNYSVADSYFYINVLSGHVSFFYSSIASFLNSIFQIFLFSLYLFISNPNTIILFSAGSLILIIPTRKLISIARSYMHISYEKGRESNTEIQRAVENMFLIKILKKDSEELENFSNTLQSFNLSMLQNHRYSLITGYLPSFLTLFLLSLFLSLGSYTEYLTLDFIGVTLKLFQSLGSLSNSVNRIVNSHVHIEKFHDLDENKIKLEKENYSIVNSDNVKFNNVTFKYFNSNENIFNNINLSIPRNTHTLLLGPNGSGKSTLIGLVAGIYYAKEGNVTSFSDKFGYIGATPLIFESTLRENLLYGNENIIEDSVLIEKLKELDTFKESNSYSLDRIVSNKSLSSGQMQKIAFIRALVSNTEILLLDEATANLDSISKITIFKLLKSKNLTIINSTHDPQSFEDADNQLVISIVNGNREVHLKSLK